MTETNPYIRNAEREGWSEWITSERDEKAVRDGKCFFDNSAANRVFRFFEKALCHFKGEWNGKPFRLADWQKKMVLGPIFGWKRTGDQTRRFRRSWIEIPKKNGKSAIGSGIGLYMLVGDHEPGAEIYSAATKKDQACNVHDSAIKMYQASPYLKNRLKLNKTTKTLFDEQTFSKYAILASDGPGSEGLNIHCLIADEMHVWSDRAFWDSLFYGGIARRQPLFFAITTAGIYDPSSLGWQEHDYAKNVLEGKAVNDEMYVYISAAGEKDDYLDPEVHRKANPGYGITVKPDEIMSAALEAKNKPSQRGPFLRYRLNVWASTGKSFFDMEKWKACNEKLDEASLSGRKCYGALDLASKLDIAAWVLLFPPVENNEPFKIVCRFYCPEETAEIRESKGTPYKTWGEQGYIRLTSGSAIDYEAIKSDILSDCSKFEVMEAAADPWNLEYLRQQLFNELQNLTIYEFPQNFSTLSNPTKELESWVVSKKMIHGGNPVLTWMAGNAVAVEDGKANVMLSKKKAKGKIDGIAALVMAVGRHMLKPESVGLIMPSWI